MHIIDRRRDPGGKSLSNRQRFIRRARSLVRQAVREASAGRSIKDADKGGEVTVPADGVHEPSFRRSNEGGYRERVLPGNKEFVEGLSVGTELDIDDVVSNETIVAVMVSIGGLVTVGGIGLLIFKGLTSSGKALASPGGVSV